MIFLQQAPKPKIEIYSYKNATTPAIILSIGKDKTHYTQLLSYSFSESVQDLQGSFSFSIAGGDNNLFDKIIPLNLIKIYEGEIHPSFIGVITTKSISCSASDNGIRRSINFSGRSITSLIAEFQLILDVKLLSAGKKVLNASDASQDVKLELEALQRNSPLKLKEFLDRTWELYLKYTGISKPQGAGAGNVSGSAGGSNIALYNIIKAFMGDSFFEVGNAENIPLPIANTFFNQDINNVLQIWQCILAPPIYEIFSRVNSQGDAKVVVRETPFDSNVWANLPIKKIRASELMDYTLHLSNDEIYTVYLAYLEGSQLSADQYIVIETADANKQGKSIFAVDEEKFKIYGLKMCQVNFRGYKKLDKDDSIIATMSRYSKRLKSWFSRLDEMYMGSITLVNNLTDSKNKVKAGDRISFLGGEFYVRDCEHSWSYGNVPTISLQVIRGGQYSKSGIFLKPLEDMGKSRIELDVSEEY